MTLPASGCTSAAARASLTCSKLLRAAARHVSPTSRQQPAHARRFMCRTLIGCIWPAPTAATRKPKFASSRRADTGVCVRRAGCVPLLMAVSLCLGHESARAQVPEARDTPIAIAHRATGAIHLDGRLDEPDWQTAIPIGPLTQREPLEGRAATEATDVRVLIDEQFLYIGVTCAEPHAGAVVSTQLTRDANLDVDDRVTIVLDPFFDHRNGFFFQINPSGARSDGQIS